MVEVIKPIIKVDIGDSQKTVKGLKEDIVKLRDAILNMEEGTDEYNSAVKQLTQSQRQLDNVMSLTKKTATALDGSYDALTHQMALLRKEWKATNDVARRNELGLQIDNINSQLKELDGSIGNFQRNVGNYVSHWEGMPEVTKDFGTAMREMNESIEPTKQKFESVSKIAGGLASGFAAVQGAAALLGIENENLEKTFITLQASIALAQGIGGLSGLVEGLGKAKVAFAAVDSGVKTVNKTMGKSGWIAVIMLVVTAVTLLISHLVKKNKAIKDGTAALKEYEKIGREVAIETMDEVYKYRLFNEMATDVNQTLENRRKASKELLKALGEEVNETNILAGINGKLSEKVNEVTDAHIKQAQSAAYIQQITDLYKEQLNVVAGGITFWDKFMGAMDNPLVGGPTGLIGSLLVALFGGDKWGEENYNKRLELAKTAYEEMLNLAKEKLPELLGSIDTEKQSWENRYKTIVDSLKTSRELLKEQYEKDIELAKQYGNDIDPITKKYKSDLAKLAKEEKEAAEKGLKSIRELLEEDLSLKSRIYNRKVERAKIAAESEEKASAETYKITLTRLEEEKDLIDKALLNAKKDEKNNAEEIIKLIQDQADKEVEIERLKYDEKQRLRKLDIQRQYETIKALDLEFRMSLRELSLAYPTSQEKTKRGVVGSLLGLGSLDDKKSEDAQNDINNAYYEEAYKAEQQYLEKKLVLHREFLAKTTDETQQLELKQNIANIELEIEESKYKEKDRLRQLDYQKEKEKQERTQAIFNASLQATSSLLSGIADAYESDEKNAEKNAEKIKSIRIAAATIDTIQGAIGAFTSAAANPGGIIGMIIGGINAAAVTAMGVANINKIKNTDATGKSTASISSVSPATNVYTNELPVTYTRNVTSASEVDMLNRDTRVYILESDIQSSNKRVAVRESESSF